jgi:DNA-binding NarL/FixJ family response regulator
MDSDNKISIVIADDSPEFRATLRLFLESVQDIWVVGEASNGEEALSLTKSLAPNILLLDLRMPRMDGFEVLDHLQESDSSAEVIVLTSHADFYYEKQVLIRGASRYMTKDGAPARLIQTIREVAGDYST